MLYENVSRICKERGISFSALERGAHLSNGLIWKWGNRTKSPNANAVKAVSNFLGVSMDELMGGENDCEVQ